ncbi:MAG TPA: CPBP family glutamic-type intramembrane protease [Bryobacteraceae bacterium]|nr:CPBP family glutamic-type intramembrane protease [Bryobacteraceae bacterium]
MNVRTRSALEALIFLLGALAYLWLFFKPHPATGLVLALSIVISWRGHRRSARELGLGFGTLYRSFSRWRYLWIVITVLFLVLGRRILFNLHTLERGLIYFVWCAAQQIVLQSMIYRPLRDSSKARWPAVLLAAVAFSIIHAPNPVLLPATFIWGAASCLLFEDCPSLWGLALLQVMLSSLLLWLTPYSMNHGFRIGPIYNK